MKQLIGWGLLGAALLAIGLVGAPDDDRGVEASIFGGLEAIGIVLLAVALIRIIVDLIKSED